MPNAVSAAFSASVHGRFIDDTLVVMIDHPPVNAVSTDVCTGLVAALEAAQATDIGAVVITGTDTCFLNAPAEAASDPRLFAVIAAIEAADKPVVAALNGAATGNGLEIALAAHGRIAARAATFAVPGIKLGLVPGAGATQRLPRLMGVLPALDFLASGRSLDAASALAAGLIDHVAGDDLIAEAVALAQALRATPLRRTSTMNAPVVDAKAFDEARANIVKKARGAAAPAELARLVGLSASQPFEMASAEEQATALRLWEGEEAAALRHLSQAERGAGEVAGLTAQPVAITTVGIAGMGLMGSGIAVACLAAGYQVIGFEQSTDAATSGRVRITDMIGKAVASGRLSESAEQAQIGRLHVTSDMNDLREAELVIEAVFDDFEVKTGLFRQLDALLKPETILATNTSYLDPDALAAVTGRPDRVLGLHFFSPANIMRLVEVVRCARTSPITLATGIALARKIKKLPIVTGVGEGFVGNHIFSAYRAEAEAMLAEGATPEDIDRAMETYGFPMGLFAVSDMAGLEIGWARRKRLAPTRDAKAFYFDVADKLCEAGRFGRKSGKGWYAYVEGRRQSDPGVHALIADYRSRHSIVPRAFSDADIMRRLLAVMAREGQALLDKGIARHGDDIDLVLVNGYGFPAVKGGPMFAAKRR